MTSTIQLELHNFNAKFLYIDTYVMSAFTLYIMRFSLCIRAVWEGPLCQLPPHLHCCHGHHCFALPGEEDEYVPL